MFCFSRSFREFFLCINYFQLFRSWRLGSLCAKIKLTWKNIKIGVEKRTQKKSSLKKGHRKKAETFGIWHLRSSLCVPTTKGWNRKLFGKETSQKKEFHFILLCYTRNCNHPFCKCVPMVYYDHPFWLFHPFGH